MFEVCIIQSDDRISITIVKKSNQQLVVTMQFNSTSIFVESCVRQSAFVAGALTELRQCIHASCNSLIIESFISAE